MIVMGVNCNTKKSLQVGDVRLTIRKTGWGDEHAIRWYDKGKFNEEKTAFEDGMGAAIETRCDMVRRLEARME